MKDEDLCKRMRENKDPGHKSCAEVANRIEQLSEKIETLTATVIKDTDTIARQQIRIKELEADIPHGHRLCKCRLCIDD